MIFTDERARRGTVFVLSLDDDQAQDADLVGAKAAALARAGRAGIHIVDGTVLTTEFTGEIDEGRPVDGYPALGELLSLARSGPWAVRSSSVLEDAGESAMAGQYESVRE